MLSAKIAHSRWSIWTSNGVFYSRVLNLALCIVWLSVVIILVWHHAFWRDEVRAITVATRGDLLSMFKSLRVEAHPSLWYLLLRGANFFIGSSATLWIVSVSVALAAVLLLALRSPFGWPLLALFLFGRVALFEYSVMARDYGISMLLMFLFAACYQRYRDRGLVLGALLFLLANTNAPSVILVGAFLLLWICDVVSEHGIQSTSALQNFILNCAIAIVGVLVCFVTIYPPAADGIPVGMRNGVELKQIAIAILEPARAFGHLTALGPLVIIGSTFGLIRFPSAFIAALASLIGLSLFFTLVYPGSYRHEALWFVFLLSMYWITSEKDAAQEQPKSIRKPFLWASSIGSAMMVLLVALQLREGIAEIKDVLVGRSPWSRSRDFGDLIKNRPELSNATIIADPDYLLEALPYYINNPTYLMREQRYGNVVTFTNNALLSLSLDDVLEVAKKLNRERGQPVVILLAQRLEPGQPSEVFRESYIWQFIVTSDQVRRFLASTLLLVRFAPSKSDESFDVYLFDHPSSG